MAWRREAHACLDPVEERKSAAWDVQGRGNMGRSTPTVERMAPKRLERSVVRTPTSSSWKQRNGYLHWHEHRDQQRSPPKARYAVLC